MPVDGSAAQRAVEYALWLTQGRSDATIVLLNVQNHETLGLSEIDARTTDQHELASRRSARTLRFAIKACEQAGARFETGSEFGPICETIDRIAHETHADQIVKGTRGLGRVLRLLLGSVATGVIHDAHVPVTLVKQSIRFCGHRPVGGQADERV
jgi:nucleotide-binding universal stress UspA family protein